MQRDFIAEGLLQLSLQGGNIRILGSRCKRIIGRRSDACKFGVALDILNRLHRAESHRVIEVQRKLHTGSPKNTQLLKCNLDRQSEFAYFFLVYLRGSVQHHEEGEKQSDEIRVRDQPAFMVGMAARTLTAAAHSPRSFVESADGGLASTRKLSNFVSSIRGFMPSRIEATPSSCISRMICSSRIRSFIFPAIGR